MHGLGRGQAISLDRMTDVADLAASSVVTEEMREKYDRDGFFVLERVLTDTDLELLRRVASGAIEAMDGRMDAEGTDQLGINIRGKRYFTDWLSLEQPELRPFLLGPLMADICRATIGPNAYLFWEQYVIKGADPRTTFAWHQDSGYVHEDHAPYVTCWIALDDVTEENGSVYLLPYPRSGIRSYIKHVKDPVTNDMVCYFGSDPGMPLVAPAGSVAVFSSTVIHRSGPNLTDRLRRVYLSQYSSEVILNKDGTDLPGGGNEPFLENGVIINDGRAPRRAAQSSD